MHWFNERSGGKSTPNKMTIYINNFDEYGPGMGLQSMTDLFEDKPYPNKEKIVEYLKNGNKTYVSATRVSDFFTGEIIPVELCGMTDGEFSWSSSLFYYVERYNLRLSREFEAKVRGLSDPSEIVHRSTKKRG